MTPSDSFDLRIYWHRIWSWHEAEELLLRAVMAPTAERYMADGGLDEPGYRYRGGAAGSSDHRPQDLLDEVVVIAAAVASSFLQAGPQLV